MNWQLRTIVLTMGMTACGLASDMARAQQPAAQSDAVAPIAPPPPTDPVIQVLLGSKPSTPVAIARLMGTLFELNEGRYAGGLLQQLIDRQLDDDQVAAIHRELGSAFFLKLGRQTALGEPARKLSLEWLDAVNRRARDEQRIAGWIEQLKSDAGGARLVAIRELQLGHDAALAPLVSALADDAKTEYHRGVREALIAIGAEAFEPLAALVAAADDPIKLRAIEVLARLDHPDKLVYAIEPAFSPRSSAEVQAAARRAAPQLNALTLEAAAARLYLQGRDYLIGSRTLVGEADGKAAVWRWDESVRQVVVERLAPRVATMQQAARFAPQARLLLPESVEIRRLYWSAMLESAVEMHGLDQSLPTDADSVAGQLSAEGATVIEDLLADALASRRPVVAVRALQLLGDVATAEILRASAPRMSLIAQAMRHEDRRVRFAALEAIAKLAPQDTFAGSSYVAEALKFFIASHGAPKALVVDPRPLTAQNRVAVVSQLGYEIEAFGDPRAALRRVLASADVELIVVDFLAAGSTAGGLLDSLRRDSRTAHIPIAIVASPEQREVSTALARRIGRAEVYEPSNQATADAAFLAALVAEHGQPFVPATLRLEQAKGALAWLASLDRPSRQRYGWRQLEPVLLGAARNPLLSPDAIKVLADLGTAPAQRLLVEVASSGTWPTEQRQAAADAFRASVAGHGIMLTSREMLAQYDRYNASEFQPQEVQQLLASILDTLEGRAGKQAEPVAAPALESQEEARN